MSVSNERVPVLMKRVRGELHGLKVKKLMALDRSDRVLVEQKLESIVNQLLYLQALADAQCSIVIEMFEHMGGRVPTEAAGGKTDG